MLIAIRKEENGQIYLDKNLRPEIDYTSPPYNFKLIEIDEKFSNIQETDFNEDLTFNTQKYNNRITTEQILSKIEYLKQQLSQTDYQAIKFAENEISLEEYSQTKTNRANWRQQINELELQLKDLL